MSVVTQQNFRIDQKMCFNGNINHIYIYVHNRKDIIQTQAIRPHLSNNDDYNKTDN